MALSEQLDEIDRVTYVAVFANRGTIKKISNSKSQIPNKSQ